MQSAVCVMERGERRGRIYITPTNRHTYSAKYRGAMNGTKTFNGTLN